jgi:hypothetical protein
MNTTDVQNKSAKQLLLFMGGFAIAYNIAIALHELGHVLAYSMVDEQMIEFVLNPFSWSWAASKNLNVFVLWGGVIFGQLFALLPLLMLKKVRAPLYLFLSKLLAACAFLINGIYLSLGALLYFGDGGSLVHVGFNTSFVVAIGIIYFMFSFLFWWRLQQHLGLNKKTPLRVRIKVIAGGIIPYMLMIFVYNLLHNAHQMVMWGGLALFGIVVSFLIALTGNWWANDYSHQHARVVASESAWKVFSFGLLVIIAEFVIFGTPPNPF